MKKIMSWTNYIVGTLMIILPLAFLLFGYISETTSHAGEEGGFLVWFMLMMLSLILSGYVFLGVITMIVADCFRKGRKGIGMILSLVLIVISLAGIFIPLVRDNLFPPLPAVSISPLVLLLVLYVLNVFAFLQKED